MNDERPQQGEGARRPVARERRRRMPTAIGNHLVMESENPHTAVFPETPPARKAWKVDWPTVRGADRWLREEWPHVAKWKTIARKDMGTVTLTAAVKVTATQAEPVLPEAGPRGACKIHAVLLSRCAGYAVEPKAEDIVNGIKSGLPSATETDAILAYLLEASEAQVDAAWKAGEFSAGDLMRCVEQIAPRDTLRAVRSVRRWLLVDEARP